MSPCLFLRQQRNSESLMGGHLHLLLKYVAPPLLSVLPRLLTMATGTDLHARHGAIMACAEVVHALYKEGLRTGR